MRARSIVLSSALCALVAGQFCMRSGAQTTAPKPKPSKAAAVKPDANLAQLMRGIVFPNSNVIFATQSVDPTTIKKDADPTAAVNPLAGTFGGWDAVENSGLALAEAANLLSVPGRVCSNGKPVPMQNADWAGFVQGLRDAGMAAYKAAQSKSQDAIVDVSDKVTTACSNCHNVYREKTDKQGGLAARCTK